MEAQFIGYGLYRGLSDIGFWIAVTLILVLAPTFWRKPECSKCFLPERKEYPKTNITDDAIKELYNYPAGDHPLYDYSRDCLLKQLWAYDLRSLIEGKIVDKIPGHFSINNIDAVVAPFTDDVPVFVMNAMVNDTAFYKIHITADELEQAIPSLLGMDWRKLVKVGNLYQVLRDLAPVIQYEEIMRKICVKN